MKEKIYIGKSLAEIEALAVKELGVSKDDMYFDVIDENVDSRDEIQVHVMVDANPVKKGKDFLETFLKEANFDGFVERKMRDNIVEYAITTADANGALIGHNSQTLAALQYVTSLIVNQYFDHETESGLIVKVDVKKAPGMRYGFADFESAGVVKETVELPKELWTATDKEQFDWLNEQIGGKVDGYTWHHTETSGIMQLVPFGIHNITPHNGGRTRGMWADAPRS